MKQCTNCGAYLEDDILFCGYCGMRLSPMEEQKNVNPYDNNAYYNNQFDNYNAWGNVQQDYERTMSAQPTCMQSNYVQQSCERSANVQQPNYTQPDYTQQDFYQTPYGQPSYAQSHYMQTDAEPERKKKYKIKNPAQKKSPLRIIIPTGIVLIAVIASVIIILLGSVGSDYKEVADAMLNTINAESFKANFKMGADYGEKGDSWNGFDIKFKRDTALYAEEISCGTGETIGEVYYVLEDSMLYFYCEPVEGYGNGEIDIDVADVGIDEVDTSSYEALVNSILKANDNDDQDLLESIKKIGSEDLLKQCSTIESKENEYTITLDFAKFLELAQKECETDTDIREIVADNAVVRDMIGDIDKIEEELGGLELIIKVTVEDNFVKKLRVELDTSTEGTRIAYAQIKFSDYNKVKLEVPANVKAAMLNERDERYD